MRSYKSAIVLAGMLSAALLESMLHGGAAALMPMSANVLALLGAGCDALVVELGRLVGAVGNVWWLLCCGVVVSGVIVRSGSCGSRPG